MPASRRIPEESRPALRALLELSATDCAALTSAIQNTEPTLNSRQLARAVANKVPEALGEQIPRVIEALIELYIIRDYTKDSVDEFVEDILEKLTYPGDFPEVEGRDRDELRAVLQPLLSFYDVLGITSKAQYIFADNEHAFCTCRALTDVRPVFGEDINQAPENALILHLLRIHYHEGGEPKIIHFAMDSLDIDDLVEALQRAKQKEETLKRELKTRGIRCL